MAKPDHEISNPGINKQQLLLHQTGARISAVLPFDLDAFDTEKPRFQVIGKGKKQR